MEREEIFGAIIVLIIIVVIALIIYNMHGDTTGEIKRIANEVFGWAKQEEIAQTEEAQKQVATNFIDRLARIYTHSLEKQQIGCTYDLRDVTLPDKYKVEIVYYPNSQQTVVKFNLLDVKEDKILASKSIEKSEEHKSWSLIPCFNTDKDLNLIEQGGDRVQLTYTTKEGLKAGENKFYEDLPKFYKKDQTHLCFITPKKNTVEYKKSLLDLKDCETNEEKGVELAKIFFSKFIAAIKKCKSFTSDVACRCEPIYFSDMPEGATINGIQKEDKVTFELYYNNKIIDENFLSTIAGSMTEEFFATKPTFKKWEEEQTFKKDTETLYIALTKNNELAFATERAAVAKGAFLRWAWAESLPSCSPAFYEVFESGCGRKLEQEEVLKRIKGNGYDKIIEKVTQDLNEQELIAAIIATESSGINYEGSLTGSSGLMQFTASTAKGYKVTYEEKTYFVCDPQGCQKEDNRAKPYIVIPAGLQLLKDKIKSIDTCKNYLGQEKQYKYREIFGIAAYNAGEDVICNAIKATEKEDPTWTEVKKELTVSLLKKSKRYPDPTKDKVKIIKCYPYYIQEYRKYFAANLFMEETKVLSGIVLFSLPPAKGSEQLKKQLATTLESKGMKTETLHVTSEEYTQPQTIAEKINKATEQAQYIIGVETDQSIDNEKTVVINYKRDTGSSLILASDIAQEFEDKGFEPAVVESEDTIFNSLKLEKSVDIKTTEGNTGAAELIVKAIIKNNEKEGVVEDVFVIPPPCGKEDDAVEKQLEIDLEAEGVKTELIDMPPPQRRCTLPVTTIDEIKDASKEAKYIVVVEHEPTLQDEETVVVNYKKQSEESLRLANEISQELKKENLNVIVAESKETVLAPNYNPPKAIEIKTKVNPKPTRTTPVSKQELEKVKRITKPLAKAIANNKKITTKPPNSMDYCTTKYNEIIEKYAKENDISASLIKGVIKKESQFNPLAISLSGSTGLMQFSCSTGKSYFGSSRVICCCKVEAGETIYTACKNEEKARNSQWDSGDGYLCNPSNDDRLNAELSIKYGAKHLRDLFYAYSEIPNTEERYKFTIAAYNQGRGAVNTALKNARVSEGIGEDDLKTPGKWQTWEYTKDYMQTGKADVQNYVVKVQAYEKDFSKCPIKLT